MAYKRLSTSLIRFKNVEHLLGSRRNHNLKDDSAGYFGHVYLFSLLHIEICEIILTIGIKSPG